MKLSYLSILLIVFLPFTIKFDVHANSIRHSIAGNFCIVQPGKTTAVLIDTADYAGVIRTAKDVQSDIQKVSGQSPLLITTLPTGQRNIIIAGTIGKNKYIDQLISSKKLDVNTINNQWEAFQIQVIRQPFKGIDHALIIAGSDKRGTIFGLYDLSQQMGVSPWNWWADVTPQRQQILALPLTFKKTDKPAVKYRGIFINDEGPALEGWMKKFTGGVFTHPFYEKVFELILRLKGNYLWPAMWGKSFCMDDPLNPKLADEYGIVMGTSHHEPMMRAQAEWTRTGTGEWNYATNKDALLKFWESGIVNNKSYEKLITIGMRGDGDEPMNQKNTLQDNIQLMQQIVADQQKLIAQNLNPDVSKVPQLWALYKEVQDYYEHGMKVPDYVTLLWCDDNWGNLRRLPTTEERKRSGGAGIYYHADYVGGPRCYKWINTLPVVKIWDQMSKAYEYGADKVWILNVGDIKPLELPLDFFLTLAWNPRAYTKDNLHTYTEQWAKLQFGNAASKEIADILNKYTKYNGWIKPELLSPTTFSQTNYREAETVIHKWKDLSNKAESIYKTLKRDQRDSYFQLVLYPVQASYTLNNLYFNVAKNRLYAAQGRKSAQEYAQHAIEAFQKDSLLTRAYHRIANGKWDGMMNQPHIGYISWRDPAYNMMPALYKVNQEYNENIGIAVEGETNAISQDTAGVLPSFNVFSRENHYFDIFAKRAGVFAYKVKPQQDWIIPSIKHGTLTDDQRVAISIDWNKAPKGNNISGQIIVQSENQIFRITIPIFNPATKADKPVKGFIETNGYIAIEAEHFDANKPFRNVQWQKIPDYGRTLSSMMPLPMTASSFTNLKQAPVLEYRCYFFTTGKIEINTLIAPTLNCLADGDMRFAVSIDNEEPQIVQIPRMQINGTRDDPAWSQSVINNVRVCKTTHNIPNSGSHTLKLTMIDPMVTLQRIVVNTGGLKPCFFFPPESPRN